MIKTLEEAWNYISELEAENKALREELHIDIGLIMKCRKESSKL